MSLRDLRDTKIIRHSQYLMPIIGWRGRKKVPKYFLNWILKIKWKVNSKGRVQSELKN